MIQLAAGCAVSALAIYLLLQQVSLDQLGKVLSSAQPLGIAGLIGTLLVSLVARTARWQLYFRPDRRLPFNTLFGTLSISYMASTLLPFRAGELVRAVFLSQRERVAIPRVVGTILIEKLFDFLAIGVMLLGLIVLGGLRDVKDDYRGTIAVAGTSIATVILVGFGFVLALAIWREPTLRLLGWVERVLPFRLGRRLGIVHMAAQFAAGTDSLRVPTLWLPILGWTAVAWVSSVAGFWCVGKSLGVDLSIPSMVFVSVVTSTGQAVPSSPGYVGVFHAAAVLGFSAFGIDAATGLAIAVLYHAFSYGPLVVIGLVAMWIGGYGLTDLVSVTRKEHPAVAAERPRLAAETSVLTSGKL